jgi:hypothetical protein
MVDAWNAGPTEPAVSFQALTESDTVPLTPSPRALYIGTGGDLVVRYKGSSTNVTFKNVANGTTLHIRPQYIMAASGVADIVGLY